MTDTGVDVLHELRRRRKRHRLGDIEWFDAAYRVYLVAIFGGGTVLWVSSSIGDHDVSASSITDVARTGPAVLGLIITVVFLAGIRGGAQGGPLALEAADVTYVMLSPVDRTKALMRPVIQRVRGAAYAGAVGGAVVGQLAGRRLPGSPAAWAASGAGFGITAGLIWAGIALIAHASRLPLWVATTIGLSVVAWQSAAVAWHVPGPANTAGSLAMWGWRQHGSDLAAPVVATVVVVVGVTMLSRTSLDALARRSSLVAQLRFAVTMQDLRTVILLRRQLNQEHTRGKPWLRVPRWVRPAVMRRGAASIVRYPATRLVRMAVLATVAGISEALVVRGTTPAVLLTALALFVLGLEAMEPLSQEIDQPDRTDSLPIERGELLVRHLVAPAIALIPFAVVAGAATVVTLGTTRAIAPAAILAVPVILAGAGGGVVSIVRDAPDPTSSTQQAFVPPEMAGFSSAYRIGLPIVVSALAASTALLMRAAVDDDTSLVGMAVRAAIGACLLIAAIVFWVRVRDRWKRAVRRFFDEGRAVSRQQRSAV